MIREKGDEMQDENMGNGVINPFPGQATEWVDYSQGSGDSDDPNHSDVRGFTQDPTLATAVTSRVRQDQVVFDPFGPVVFHKPVIDLDLDAKLVPSSTPGHHHLLIDKILTWDQYVRLLCVLAEVGLIEPGYVSASIERGYTSVRLPHVKRDVPRVVESFPVEDAPALPLPPGASAPPAILCESIGYAATQGEYDEIQRRNASREVPAPMPGETITPAAVVRNLGQNGTVVYQDSGANLEVAQGVVAPPGTMIDLSHMFP